MKAVFVLSQLLLGQSLGSLLTANLQINEHGLHYNQTEAYDPLTSDVVTYVPNHNRDNITLHEVIKIENEALGLVMWKVTDETVCHIEDLDAETQPQHFFLQTMTMEAKNVTLNMNEIRSEYVHAVDDGKWKGDRNILTKDMIALCKGSPIRKSRKVILTKTGFEALVKGEDRMAPRMAHCCCPGRQMARSTEMEIVHMIVVSDGP